LTLINADQESKSHRGGAEKALVRLHCGHFKKFSGGAEFCGEKLYKIKRFSVLPMLLKNIFAFGVAFANCLRYKP